MKLLMMAYLKLAKGEINLLAIDWSAGKEWPIGEQPAVIHKDW